jgi:hypothetical protein
MPKGMTIEDADKLTYLTGTLARRANIANRRLAAAKFAATTKPEAFIAFIRKCELGGMSLNEIVDMLVEDGPEKL